MEPMLLGSPVSSPHGLHYSSLHSTPSAADASLPPFLMRDSMAGSVQTSRLNNAGLSPTKSGRQRSSTSACITSPISPQPHLDQYLPNKLPYERTSGPPTLSLMGARVGPPSGAIHSPGIKFSSPFVEQNFPNAGSATPGMYNPTLASPFLASANTSCAANYSIPLDQSLLCRQDVDDGIDDTWVTVFGFPASSASYMLTQFAQLGVISEHQSPGLGNWMHLKYQTRLQARRALSKNGKVYDGNIMIGVIPCTEKSLLRGKEKILGLSNVNNMMLESVTSPKGNIRPLSQAFQGASVEHQVVENCATPKRSDGILSRAVHHLLGI